MAASVAPRKFIRAFEFGWEGAEEPDYPNLWVDGMKRSEKVWGFYNATENLASSQAYGLIRLSMERVSHCFSIGPQQREELYPTLQTMVQHSLSVCKGSGNTAGFPALDKPGPGRGAQAGGDAKETSRGPSQHHSGRELAS